MISENVFLTVTAPVNCIEGEISLVCVARCVIAFVRASRLVFAPTNPTEDEMITVRN